MALRFLDTFPGSGVFASVEFNVAGPALPPPDAFRVEAGRGLVRCAIGGRPARWARIDPYLQGEWLFASDFAESAAVIPPWRFEEARRASGRLETSAHGAEWAKRTARALLDSPRSPLHASTFRLTHLRGTGQSFSLVASTPYAAHERAYVPDVPPLHLAPQWFRWQGAFGVTLTLRKLSPPGSARRHAWRKAAREGWLPPVLLHWISGLNAYVVLDGHDRLAAARDEGVAVDALALWRVVYEPRGAEAAWRGQATAAYERASPGEPRWQRTTADYLNRQLVDAFATTDIGARSRAVARSDLGPVFVRELGPRLAGHAVHPMLDGL